MNLLNLSACLGFGHLAQNGSFLPQAPNPKQALMAATEKGVSTQSVLKDKASATLISIKKDAVLKAHQRMTNAMLVLLSGKVIYEEKERSENLSEPNDFVLIPAHVTHKLTGLEDAQLLLIQSRKSCVPASSGSYHISSVPANSVAHWRGGQEVQADGAEP